MINNEVNQKLVYPVSLLVSNGIKKTCEGLGKTIGKSGDAMLRILEHNCTTIEDLAQVAPQLFPGKKLYALIDDTLIEKMYSKIIQGTSDNFDSSDRRVLRSLCTVVCVITDGKYALPIDHRIWIARDVAQDKYQSKTELAQELILQIVKLFNIEVVVMDGLFATIKMIDFLNQHNIFFEMRFHSNRKIQLNLDDDSISLKDVSELTLNKKNKQKTITAYWHEIPVYITAVERKSKTGKITIVYQISNCPMTAADHRRIYSYRWNIEKFFRTAKQHLGLTHCQSKKLISQRNHIRNVFFAYAVLQLAMKRHNRKFKNPETALRAMKASKSHSLMYSIISSNQIFGGVYA